MMFWFLLAAQAGVPGNQGLYCVPYSQYEAPSALRALPSQSPAARTSRAPYLSTDRMSQVVSADVQMPRNHARPRVRSLAASGSDFSLNSIA